MDQIHVLLMTNCGDSGCSTFVQSLQPLLDRNFRSVKVGILCAYSLTEALDIIHQHRATLMVVAIHYSAWENLRKDELPRLYSQIYNAIDLSSEIVLIEKNGQSSLTAIAKKINASIVSEQDNNTNAVVVNKINESLARKSSDGKLQLNLQMVRFEERLAGHIEAGNARIDILQRQLETLEDQIVLLDMKLFRYNPDTNQTAPLIEQVRLLQRSLAATNTELGAAVKSLEVMRRHAIDCRHRIEELEHFEERIEEKINLVHQSGLKWLSKLGAAIAAFFLALAVNSAGLGDWFSRMLAILLGNEN